MAEYISRERLKEAFSTDAQHSLSYFSDSLFELLLLEIDECPAADVVPVVLCKDCVRWLTDFCPISDAGEDDFCSYGEKRSGDG